MKKIKFNNMTTYQRLICIMSCLIMLLLSFICLTISKQPEKCNTVAFQGSQATLEMYVVSDKTTFSAYTLSVEETDQSPCVGAGNNNLCELRKEMRICASRDLPLDTLIYIQEIGECVIKDRMNIRFKGSNRIDILMESRDEAKKFGVRRLNYVIVK